MEHKPFVMKQFSVRHRLSAMKVGVDAVLLGAWCELPPSGNVLDAGCGCGIISLMIAQRQPGVAVTAIDIDPLAIIEARQNFAESPWSGRIYGQRYNFIRMTGKFDAIVSNPPFFDDGVSTFSTRREVARHAGEFSPRSLLHYGSFMLNDGGTISMICPPDRLPDLLEEADISGLHLKKYCEVFGNPDARSSRLMLTFTNTAAIRPTPEKLTIEFSRGKFTPEYQELTRNFYLHF